MLAWTPNVPEGPPGQPSASLHALRLPHQLLALELSALTKSTHVGRNMEVARM